MKMLSTKNIDHSVSYNKVDIININKPLTTPVLFLIFNRPETTQRVFNAIKKAKPTKLYVSADGPRKDRIGEQELCLATRDIIKQIDWKCEVYTNFHENNMGLKHSISSSIDWFFENVEDGIILEDDCFPTQSFFWFCQELLKRYRDDERIMAICGNNLQFGHKRGEASYYFSKIFAVWGWATWGRAWRHFNLKMDNLSNFKAENQIQNVFGDEISRIYWMNKIQDAYDSGNSWAFPWMYSIFIQNGLCICPNVNLISNIGFEPNATHATDSNSLFANMQTSEIKEITHPVFILPNKDADEFLTRIVAKEQMPGIIDQMKKTIVIIANKILLKYAMKYMLKHSSRK